MPLKCIAPSNLETSRRVVKGLVLNGHISDGEGLTFLSRALRRRRLGLLDEQLFLHNKSKSDRGHENFFVEEFVSRPIRSSASDSTNNKNSNSTFTSARPNRSLGVGGFQCVARKHRDDFISTPKDNGNHVDFKITLRHIPPHDVPDVERSLKLVQSRGFLNYFAPSEQIGAHVRHGLLPGLQLLQGHYAAAFETLCRAPRLLKKSNTDATLRLSGGNSEEEGGLQVLRAPENEVSRQSKMSEQLLAHRPVELSDALCRGVLESVVGHEGCSHLVQEFAATVWNECLTRRVREHGPGAAVAGDFVVEEARSDDDDGLAKLRVLSSSSSSSFFDDVDPHSVVLPTLGYASQFSANSTWARFTSLALQTRGCSGLKGASLDEDDDQQQQQQQKQLRDVASTFFVDHRCALGFQSALWNVPGAYRRPIEFARDLKFSLRPDIELSEEELGFSLNRVDKLLALENQHQQQQQRSNRYSSSSSSSKKKHQQQQLDTILRRECLHQLDLTFSLPAGTSPWMFLRELCKRERFIVDLGFRKSLELRAENKKANDAEISAIRYRLYNEAKKRNKWTGLGMPDTYQTGKLWASVFHSNGMRKSLIPSARKWNDVLD